MLQIDTLVLANHAEVHNGMLYMMGAGWTDMRRRRTPKGATPPSHFGIGLMVLVPWSFTNQQHRLSIWIEDEDAAPLWKGENRFQVGRPEMLPSGAEQRNAIAISVTSNFPRAGGYRVCAEVNEQVETRKTYSFRIHDIAAEP